MKNTLLVKIQTNVNQRKHIHNNLLSKVSHTIKIENLTIKIGVICLYKNLFFFARPNRFLYVWVFKCQISACRSYVRAFFFLNIILRLLTKHMLQLQNLKLKGSIYRYYRLDKNYIKTRRNNTAVVIIRTITIDRPANYIVR